MLDLFEVRTLSDGAIEYVIERLKAGGSLGRVVLERTDLRDGLVTALLPRALLASHALDFEKSILPRSELNRSKVPDAELADFLAHGSTETPGGKGRLVSEVRTLPDGDHEVVDYAIHDLYPWVEAEIAEFLDSEQGGICVIQHWASSSDRLNGDLKAEGLRTINSSNDVYLVVYPEDDASALDRSIRSANAAWMGILAVCFNSKHHLLQEIDANGDWPIANTVRLVAVSAYDGNACLLWRRRQT